MLGPIAYRLLSRSTLPGRTAFAVTALLLVPVTIAFAGEADVLKVDVSCDSKRICRFSVTLEHADEGWEHYADQWEVVAPDGTVLGTRVLAHPHVREQPFTRSLSKVSVPDGVKEVTVRARDSVHGYGGKEKLVSLPR